MILDIFKYSLEYSIKDKIAFFKLSALSIISFLIIPYIIIEGYCYRIINIQLVSFINADDPLPSYNNIKKLLIQGIKIIVIKFIYSIPIIIAMALSFSTIININQNGATIDISSEALLIIFLFILGFLTFMFSKTAIVHMVYKKSITSGFNIKEIISLIKDIKVINYFYFFISYIVLIMAILVGIFLLGAFIGSIFGFNYIPVNFYIGILGLDITIIFLVYILIVYPLLKIFESRAISSLYNMR